MKGGGAWSGHEQGMTSNPGTEHFSISAKKESKDEQNKNEAIAAKVTVHPYSEGLKLEDEKSILLF